MKDVCKLLGIEKLNTTAHHPGCDGAVKRFNQTLKTMLRKQAAKYGAQWDQELFGLIEIPHTAEQGKSHLTYYLVWTVVLQQKLLSYHLSL